MTYTLLGQKTEVSNKFILLLRPWLKKTNNIDNSRMTICYEIMKTIIVVFQIILCSIELQKLINCTPNHDDLL